MTLSDPSFTSGRSILEKRKIMARLPFSIEHEESRNSPPNPDQWRAPRIQVPNCLRGLEDEVSHRLIEESYIRRQSNPATMFFHNMLSLENYDGRHTDDYIRFGYEFLEARYETRQASRVDQDLEDTISSIYFIHCCGVVNGFPELMDALNNRDYDKVETGYRQWRKVIAELESFQNQGPEPRGYRGDSGRSDRGFMSQYSSGSGRSGYDRGNERRDDGRRGYRGDAGFPNRRMIEESQISGRDAQSNTNWEVPRFIPVDDGGVSTRGHQGGERYSASPSSDRFGVQKPVEEINRPQRIMMPSRDYMSMEAEKQPSTPAPPPPPAAPPAPPPVADWSIPVNSQTSRETKVAVEHPEITRVKPIDDMNKQLHSGIYPTSHARGEAVVEAAFALVNKTRDGKPLPDLQKDTIVSGVTVMDRSLTNAVARVSSEAVELMIRNSGDNPSGRRQIVHTEAIIDNGIIGYAHLDDLAKNIIECESLRDISNVLSTTIEAVTKHADKDAAFATDLLAAAKRFDRVITNEINMFCRESLGISKGNAIKSFVANFDDLISAVHAQAPRETNDALLVFLSELAGSFRETVKVATAGIREELTLSNEDTDSKAPDLKAAVLPLSHVITHLPFTAGELGIDTDGTVSLGTTEIGEFLKSVIKGVQKHHDEKPECFQHYRHILMTRDMVVWRVMDYPGRPDSTVLIPIQMN